MSNEDYCVYARNILSRLHSIGAPTTQFTSDIVRETGNRSNQSTQMNMGLIITAMIVLMFLVMAVIKKKQVKPVCKM